MRIMTFNTRHRLNYVTKKIDFDVMARAISADIPAIIASDHRPHVADVEF